jgi:lysophospholipase L1-like esterase
MMAALRPPVIIPAEAKDIGVQKVIAGGSGASWKTDAVFHVTEGKGETNLVANAGPDQTVSGPSPVAVQFDGSGSTGDIVRYQWYNQWGLLRAEGATLVIEVNFGYTDPQPGTARTFTLVVEDSQGNTAQDEVSITLGETEEEETPSPPEGEGEIDIEVADLYALYPPICAGPDIVFRASFRNNGSKESGPFLIRFIADNTDTFDGGHASEPAGATGSHDHGWRPYLSPGEHTLEFIADFDNQIPETDEDNNSAILTFTAEDCSDTPVPPEAQPTIALDPTEGLPGTEVTATGSGWTAGEIVIIQFAISRFGDNLTFSEVAQAPVGDDGSFETTFTVPPDAPIGAQKVIAGTAAVSQQTDAVFRVTGEPAVTVERALTEAPDESGSASSQEKTTFHPGDTIWYAVIVRNSGPPVDVEFTWQGKHADPEIGTEIYSFTNTLTLGREFYATFYSPAIIPSDAPVGTYLNRETVRVGDQEFVRESRFEVVSQETPTPTPTPVPPATPTATPPPTPSPTPAPTPTPPSNSICGQASPATESNPVGSTIFLPVLVPFNIAPVVRWDPPPPGFAPGAFYRIKDPQIAPLNPPFESREYGPIKHKIVNWSLVERIDNPAACGTPMGQKNLVGLGDSVAAGHGLGPSDGFSKNPHAYPMLLAATHLAYTGYDHAISGACAATNPKVEKSDKRDGENEEHKDAGSPSTPDTCKTSVLSDELPKVTVKPDLITLTVGANDIQFDKCFEALVLETLGLATDPNPCQGETFDSRLKALSDNLSLLFTRLKENHPGVPIYVMEYYNPLPPPPASAADICLLARLIAYKNGKTGDTAASEQQTHLYNTAESIIERLNQTIEDAASAAGVNTVPLHFQGHDLCRTLTGGYVSDTWVYGPSVHGEFQVLRQTIQRVDFDLPDPCPVPHSEDRPYPIKGSVVGYEYDFTVSVNCMPHPTRGGQSAIAAAFRATIGP